MRILAIGAHPDDIEFACGGILLVEATRGAEISLCICSRGESGTNGSAEEREREARAAADLLGARIEFVEFGGDALIERSKKNALELAQQIRASKPDVLLRSVTSEDQHPDHVLVGQLAREAARLARYGGIAELRHLEPHSIMHQFEYAVTPGAEPRSSTRLRVDISSQYEKWIALMECHRTQLRTRRYIDLQIARARLLGIDAGVEYAQALFSNDDLLVSSLADVPASVRLF